MYSFWIDEGTLGRTASAERLAYSASGRSMYCRADGTPKTIGTPLRNPDYAGTLRQIAEGGADVLYRGTIAEPLAAAMAANGALPGRADQEDYRQRQRPVLGKGVDEMVKQGGT